MKTPVKVEETLGIYHFIDATGRCVMDTIVESDAIAIRDALNVREVADMAWTHYEKNSLAHDTECDCFRCRYLFCYNAALNGGRDD